MTEQERMHLIESLCFITGKGAWWYEDKTDQELNDEYDRLTTI